MTICEEMASNLAKKNATDFKDEKIIWLEQELMEAQQYIKDNTAEPK